MSHVVRYDLFRDFDVATVTDYTYGVFEPSFRTLPKAAKTSGSSTTWVDVTSGDGFAGPLAVGDELYVPSSGTRVFVTAKASDSSITVSTAADLTSSGKNLHFRKHYSGTSTTSGIVDTSRLREKTVHISFDDITATSITVTIEGRVSGGEWTTVYTYPAKTSSDIVATSINPIASVPVTEHFEQMRVGAKVTGDAGAQSFTAFLTGLEE